MFSEDEMQVRVSDIVEEAHLHPNSIRVICASDKYY